MKNTVFALLLLIIFMLSLACSKNSFDERLDGTTSVEIENKESAPLIPNDSGDPLRLDLDNDGQSPALENNGSDINQEDLERETSSEINIEEGDLTQEELQELYNQDALAGAKDGGYTLRETPVVPDYATNNEPKLSCPYRDLTFDKWQLCTGRSLDTNEAQYLEISTLGEHIKLGYAGSAPQLSLLCRNPIDEEEQGVWPRYVLIHTRDVVDSLENTEENEINTYSSFKSVWTAIFSSKGSEDEKYLGIGVNELDNRGYRFGGPVYTAALINLRPVGLETVEPLNYTIELFDRLSDNEMETLSPGTLLIHHSSPETALLPYEMEFPLQGFINAYRHWDSACQAMESR